MNKPLSIIIKETREKLATICNESGLPPVILDLIIQKIYSDVRYLSEKQTLEETEFYNKSLEEESDKVIE